MKKILIGLIVFNTAMAFAGDENRKINFQKYVFGGNFEVRLIEQINKIEAAYEVTCNNTPIMEKSKEYPRTINHEITIKFSCSKEDNNFVLTLKNKTYLNLGKNGFVEMSLKSATKLDLIP